MNSKFISDVAWPMSLCVITNPLNFSRTLMMVGYEPLPYYVSKSFFNPSKTVYYYPNIFSYLKKLYEQVGLRGLFLTGLPTAVITNFLNQMTTQAAGERIITDFEKKKCTIETQKGYKTCLQSSIKIGLARTCGVIITYPLQVIMVRQMVDKVNNYGVFTSLIGTAIETVDKGGIRALFHGLVPRCMAEMISTVSIGSFVYLLDNYVFNQTKDNNPEAVLKEQTNTVASLCVASFTHPFFVVSLTMCLSGSTLPLTHTYINSTECFRHLLKSHNLNRGASLFFRSLSPASIQ